MTDVSNGFTKVIRITVRLQLGCAEWASILTATVKDHGLVSMGEGQVTHLLDTII